MTLKVQIQDDMKSAMKSGEKHRLGVVRLILAAIKQIEIDERRELSEADVLAVLNKMVKQRRDSVSQFQQGGRSDLADKELSEIEVIDTYLPEQMSETDLDTLVERVIAETGAESIRDMGKVMAAIKAAAKGQADMGIAGAKVKARLS